eukprot:SM000091S24607  [mRNA]  locus=s91:366683:369911:+ [translate_table: standard]
MQIPAGCGGWHRLAEAASENHERRRALYRDMARDLASKGPVFLDGATTQSLQVSDIFQVDGGGNVTPIFKHVEPAVRANVLHLPPSVAQTIAKKVKSAMAPIFPGGVWYQDPDIYHFSLFHASNNESPVEATREEVEEEARAVQREVECAAPMKLAIDRVVFTSTGVLLGCWQLLSGTEPVQLRKQLKEALPNAPRRQLYNVVMLHTSFARILTAPQLSSPPAADVNATIIAALEGVVTELNEQLCHMQATVNVEWFVEEWDLLALAIGGNMTVRPNRLLGRICAEPGPPPPA